MVFFGILVSTGLSQKFYTLNVSQWFILGLGGIDSIRLIHRIAGIAFATMTMTHVGSSIFGIIFKKWRPTMMISKKDFQDVIHNLRYYLGEENQPAPCERYTYKQKFEYWNILMGGLLMIISGMILLFPVTVSRIMPGEVIPAAKIIHSSEALLVFLIIAIWHMYNAIFSPEVFPLDTSIFTGYISRERMEQKHSLELDRIIREDPEALEEGEEINADKELFPGNRPERTSVR